MVVGTLASEVGIGPKVRAKEIASHPVRFLAQDLMVQVIDDMKLKRVARALDGLDAVNDAASRAVDEVSVEKGDGSIELSGQFGLPLVPFLLLEVIARDPPAAAIEEMQVITAGLGSSPHGRRVDRLICLTLR